MEFLDDDDEVANLRNSGQFDEAWYVEEYPDVKMIGMDPARHYLWLGARLGRRPSQFVDGGIPTGTRFGAAGARDQILDAPPKENNGVRRAIKKIQNAVDARNYRRVFTAEIREKIAESGLFDENYYSTEYAHLISNHDDLLADYISAFHTDLARDPGPLFSTRHYFDSNPDVRDMHPLIHYVRYGLEEGRAAFCPAKVNSFLSTAGGVKLKTLFDIVPLTRPVNVLYWERGNFFFTDVARFLEQLLNELGYRATLLTDLPASGCGDALNLVVAPHEFCALGPGREWTEDQYAEAVYVNTEQWQTSWFSLSLKYVRRTRRGVLDLNPSSAEGLAKIGFTAAFLPLLPLPGSCFDFSEKKLISEHVRRLKFIEPLEYPSNLHDRAYDIVYCAVFNDRRSRALARMAPVLSAHRCFIHMPRFTRPIKPGEPDVLSAADFAQITRNSKIMLNIHQGESHYLEWQRVFLVGMMQGAVVVSEPCYANEYVKPDVHYVEASIEHMPRVIADLLSTEAGRQKMLEISSNVVRLRQAIAAGERLLG
jgi:hypothetical protein